ncbi:MAG: hypothetical protein HZB91_09850 [Elusimicrobia bacterium]|nr:hypothetical protein [Elusimicrobiota bacterium]
MRLLIVALAVLALGCKKAQVAEVKKAAADARAGDTAATRYVETLQNDVKKAQDVAGKANASIEATNQAVDQVQKAEEGQ